MPCQILVAYQCGSPVGEIVAIVSAGHVFSRLETLQANGWDKTTWSRSFTVIRVEDKAAGDLTYLRERFFAADGLSLRESGLGRYYFGVPTADSDEYAALNAYGEIECNWLVAEAFLQERS